MSAKARSWRAGFFTLARVLVAIALLAWVATSVPWRDSLDIDGTSFRGRVVGEWKGDLARFEFEPGQAFPAAEEGGALESALRLGGLVEVDKAALRTPPFEVGPDGPRAVQGAALERVEGEFAWQPGMPRAFSDLDARGVLSAFGFLVLSTLICATRWWRLLGVAGCGTPYLSALRLTYVGLFFNLVVPGLTGGDLMRGVLAVREHPDQRADALMSVVVDRLIGVLTLIAMAAVVIFATGERLAELRLPVSLVLLGIVTGLVAFLNPTVRRLTRFDAIVARLPQAERLQKLDAAAKVYARHPLQIGLAVGLSVVNHLANTAAAHGVALAFGSDITFLEMLSVASVANTLSSVPLAPGGWGVGEAIFGTLFKMLGRPATLGVATSVTYRLCYMGLGVTGGLTLFLPGGRQVREDVRETRVALETDPPG